LTQSSTTCRATRFWPRSLNCSPNRPEPARHPNTDGSTRQPADRTRHANFRCPARTRRRSPRRTRSGRPARGWHQVAVHDELLVDHGEVADEAHGIRTLTQMIRIGGLAGSSNASYPAPSQPARDTVRSTAIRTPAGRTARGHGPQRLAALGQTLDAPRLRQLTNQHQPTASMGSQPR